MKIRRLKLYYCKRLDKVIKRYEGYLKKYREIWKQQIQELNVDELVELGYNLNNPDLMDMANNKED